MKISLTLFFCLFTLVHWGQDIVYTDKDKNLFSSYQKLIGEKIPSSENNGLVLIGQLFLGTPYVAKTLEIGETESLVVNLRGLDCTTYVENTLALGLLAKSGSQEFDSFTNQLETVRYRDGMINGYASRLHYFTDWIRNNEQKGLLKNITADIGGVEIEKDINFMGTHRELYPFLKDDKNFNQIVEIETELTKEAFCYLPKAQIEEQEDLIQSGDIIALATSIKGLDVTHTGFAIRQPSGRIHLLHASISGEVKISEEPLVDYLKKVKNNIGILVVRPQGF